MATSPANSFAYSPSRPAAAAKPPLTAHAILAPKADELALLLIGAALGSVALLLQGRWLTVMNIGIPAILVFTMLRGATRMFKQSVASVWTPLLWMRAAILFYGGFGTLITLLANNDSRNYMETFFEFYSADILKYNVILIWFTLLSLSAVYVFVAQVGKKDRRSNGLFHFAPCSVGLNVVGAAFLLVGTAANFLFIVPYQFGFVETTFPAAMSEISQAAIIGLFLTTTALARRRSPLLLPVIALGLSFALIGLMAFSKSSILMPIVMLGLAFFYLKPTLFRIGIVAASTVTLFFAAAPLVDHGRYVMNLRYGGTDAPASISERLGILYSYFDENTSTASDQDVNFAAVRFSYVNVGTYVIAERDSGISGDTYRNALTVFIPRVIWKNKPVITDIARELSYAATGNWNSSVAPGIAPEAYWNGGWFGLVAIALITGAIIALWSVYNLSVQTSEAWHLFMIVLLGVRMGSRFDGFFVVDVLGPIAFGLIGHYVLLVLNAAIARRRMGQ